MAYEGKLSIGRSVSTDFAMGGGRSRSRILTTTRRARGTNRERDFGCAVPGRPGSGGVNWPSDHLAI